MEKGKKAIQENEEENGFSSLENYQPILGSSSSELPFDQPDPDSAEGEEMEETVDDVDEEDDDFFSKLSKTHYLTYPPPAGFGKSLVESSSNPEAVAATEPAAGADKAMGQVVVGTDDASAALPALPTSSRAKPLEYRKPLSLEELEEMAKTNPTKAKRIMLNRRSAMRAKEKKKLYAADLEHQFAKLKALAAQASATLNLLETERKSLIQENSKLKDHMEFTKQMIAMQESKNDDVRKEIQFNQQLLARQMRTAAGVNMMSNSRSSAPSINDPSMAARNVFQLNFINNLIQPGVQHGFQQQPAGQHPNQPSQPPQEQQHHQNYSPMLNNGLASPRRQLGE